MFGLGLPEMMVVLIAALVFFGLGKLPSIGQGLGEAVKNFKKGIAEGVTEEKRVAAKKVGG